MVFDIQIVVINEFGTFCSGVREIEEENYDDFLEISKLFWITDTSFSLETDNGIIVFPPEIIKKSILKIEKLN